MAKVDGVKFNTTGSKNEVPEYLRPAKKKFNIPLNFKDAYQATSYVPLGNNVLFDYGASGSGAQASHRATNH